MDKTVLPDKYALRANKDSKAKNGAGRKVQEEDVETDQAKAESPGSTGKPDETPKKATQKQQADTVPVDGDSLCSVCGFTAKCPRALKIHFARRHRGSSENNSKHVKPAAKQNQQADLDEPQAAASDGGKRSSDESFSTPQRRVSKRTPKPKIIHSCNSCGEEFLGKSLLDLHFQKYHAKDPSEYMWLSQVQTNWKFSLMVQVAVYCIFKLSCKILKVSGCV